MTEPATPSRRHTVGAGAAIGVVAAVVALGVAELVAAASPRLRSPVLDVGDRIVDLVPAPVKQLAIDWFGTRDKVALLVGIGVVLALFAAGVGIVARRGHLAAGVAGIATFGAIGVVAVVAARDDRPAIAVLPALMGSAAGVAALIVCCRVADTGSSATTEAPTTPDGGHSRRALLVVIGAFAVGGAAAGTVGRELGRRFSAATARAAVVLPSARRPRPRPGPAIESGVDGVTPFFTPNRSFYRIDTALSVPQVRPDDWRLRVHGMVRAPLELSYADLLARDLVEADVTLTCVSNEVGGRLLGTARWLGARLDQLLDEVGVSRQADQVVGRSVDGYTCGFPVAALDGRDALVAVGMNGESLPLAHGFPARLIVPGLYGYVSATKWLTEIELTRFDRFDQYWVPRGWDADAPIKTSSRIDTPRGLARLAPGPVMIGGVAWAQTRGIAAVEVRIDDGPWEPATLAAELNDATWRQWTHRWDATPGRHSLTVRATDATGDIQTAERSEPMPNGSTGHHQIVVIVDR